MANMRLMMEYFSLFDGETPWEEMESKIQATFHDKLVVKDGRESFTKDEFVERLRNFVEKGGSMEILKLKKVDDATGNVIQYKLVFHEPGEKPKTTTSVGIFENNKLIRVQRDTARRAVAVL